VPEEMYYLNLAVRGRLFLGRECQGSGVFRTYGGLALYAADDVGTHGLWARARHVIM
jgi:hypothetical protein